MAPYCNIHVWWTRPRKMSAWRDTIITTQGYLHIVILFSLVCSHPVLKLWIYVIMSTSSAQTLYLCHHVNIQCLNFVLMRLCYHFYTGYLHVLIFVYRVWIHLLIYINVFFDSCLWLTLSDLSKYFNWQFTQRATETACKVPLWMTLLI